MGYYNNAATAGHDTTSNTTAGAMWALAERPELLGQMQVDPSLIPAFVEESIRWVVPVKHFMRSAVADCEIGGKRIAKGDWLMLCYQSGNRDETVFENPDRFDIRRPVRQHLAFGAGTHVCVGSRLAEMQLRVAFTAMAATVRRFEVVDQPRRVRSNFINGFKQLNLKLHS